MSIQVDRSNVISVPGKPASENYIGALLVDAGRLIPQDAERVLRYAKEKGLRFGDAVVELGLATREEVDRAVALQFSYPYVMPGESAISPEVLAAYRPLSREVEEFRALRSQLLLRWFTDSPERKRLAITSVARGDGRSYTLANLAVVFSQLGEHTLLVDADMRHSRQHRIFGMNNSVGLSTVLSGRAGTDAIQRVPAFSKLSVLPSGPRPPNPQELLDRPSFAQSVEEWSKHFDVVLFDTAAATVAADARVVAAKAGAAMVLTKVNKSKYAQVKALHDELNTIGVAVVGSVLNK